MSRACNGPSGTPTGRNTWRVFSNARSPGFTTSLPGSGTGRIPGELALLPIVESAYDPFAYSRGRALGAWQFIASTGKNYGLNQNWWYDGRRDVWASTDAALDYLGTMAEMFDGDWLLALAGYNSGENRVARQVKKNLAAGKPAEFWDLKLPRETRGYVPKLLGLTCLFKYPEKFDFEIPDTAG